MDVLGIVLYSLTVLVALMLIGLVLVQPSKSGGFGGSFGGLGETVFGAHAISHLSKLTVFFISLFFVLVFALALLNSRRDENSSALLNGLSSTQKIDDSVDSAIVKDKKNTVDSAIVNTTQAKKDSEVKGK